MCKRLRGPIRSSMSLHQPPMLVFLVAWVLKRRARPIRSTMSSCSQAQASDRDTGSLARRGFVDFLGEFKVVRTSLGDLGFVVVDVVLATRLGELDGLSLAVGFTCSLAAASWASLSARASRRRRLLR